MTEMPTAAAGCQYTWPVKHLEPLGAGGSFLFSLEFGGTDMAASSSALFSVCACASHFLMPVGPRGTVHLSVLRRRAINRAIPSVLSFLAPLLQRWHLCEQLPMMQLCYLLRVCSDAMETR